MNTAASPTQKRFTHFWDREDGRGDYRDYANLATVLRAHSRIIKDPKTQRSWIKDCGSDGQKDEMVADWRSAPDAEDQP